MESRSLYDAPLLISGYITVLGTQYMYSRNAANDATSNLRQRTDLPPSRHLSVCKVKYGGDTKTVKC